MILIFHSKHKEKRERWTILLWNDCHCGRKWNICNPTCVLGEDWGKTMEVWEGILENKPKTPHDVTYGWTSDPSSLFFQLMIFLFLLQSWFLKRLTIAKAVLFFLSSKPPESSPSYNTWRFHNLTGSFYLFFNLEPLTLEEKGFYSLEVHYPNPDVW